MSFYRISKRSLKDSFEVTKLIHQWLFTEEIIVEYLSQLKSPSYVTKLIHHYAEEVNANIISKYMP